MTLSFRHKRRLRPVHGLLALAALFGGLAALFLWVRPSQIVAWLTPTATAGPPQPTRPVVRYRHREAPLRTLPPASVAPPTCCTLVATTAETDAAGCTWQVATWQDSAPTRAPVSCPDGVIPTRGHPTLTLSETFRETGSEGCSWAAARWSDGIVTRVPADCPADAVAARRALPAAPCYEPLPPMEPATAVALAGRTMRNARPGSLFQRCRVVSHYGYPELPVMGILGDGDRAAVVPRLRAQAQAYEDAAPLRLARPAFHLLATVAQGLSQPDNSYISRMALPLLQQWVDEAERQDWLVFVDLQVGHSSPMAELERVLPLLRNPRVHLALDPEFAMPAGVVPGQDIGTMDAATINAVQARLQALVTKEGLPHKILLVHQFQPAMITDKRQLVDEPDVDLVIDMDGFGPSEAKLANYDQFVGRENAEFSGIKLFYQQDPDLLTPEQVVKLRPAPDVVIYQ